MPYASQRYSADTTVSNRAALGDRAFDGFSRTLNGQAPARELQHRIPDPVLPFMQSFILTGVMALAFILSSCVHSGDLVSDSDKLTDDLKTISEHNYSLSIPKDLVNEDITVQDSFAERYSNRDLTVSIESAAGTSKLNYLKAQDRVLNFQEIPLNRSDLIGGQAAFEFTKEQANFEDPDKPIVRILSVDCKNVEKSVTFMVLYSNRKYDDIASRILKSVTVSCSN
ncbi:MAG: hypothetical protein KA746_04425 [Pyrinomonadaceae bacterium]|nr:hypothetical protein [Pyrinomonadaceae bacterium]MBP6213674.1 hypothetical protein [Pyrinomonadaceae bacterium]